MPLVMVQGKHRIVLPLQRLTIGDGSNCVTL